MVLTSRGADRILDEGGSQAWRVNRARARKQKYLVCAQHGKKGKSRGAIEPHGTAFLVGRIRDVVPATDAPHNGKWRLIRVDAFARVSIPDAWNGQRNPVRYGALEAFGIDLSTLDFQQVVERG